MSGELRMHAYYYGFSPTGSEEVDRILSAVASAGKAYHHTSEWTSETGAGYGHEGDTPIEWIQIRAEEAASRLSALTRERDSAQEQAETDRQHALRLFRDLHAVSTERDSLRAQLAEARAAAPRWVGAHERWPNRMTTGRVYHVQFASEVGEAVWDGWSSSWRTMAGRVLSSASVVRWLEFEIPELPAPPQEEDRA